jgi:hypothetical protein
MKTISWICKAKRILPAALTLVVLSGFFAGCYRQYYNVNHVNSLDKEAVEKYETAGRYFILRDGLDAYKMENLKISDNSLTCNLLLLPYHRYMFLNNTTNGPGIIKSTEQEYIFNEVHIHVNNPLHAAGLVTIPLDNLTKVEIFIPDKESNLSTGTITALSIGGAVLAAILITTLSKDKEPEPPPPPSSGSSCPFIFSYDGSRYNFSGEIYGGAISPRLERHDYLPLPGIVPFENNYHVLMSNLAHEIQYTNLTELVVLDHHPADKFVIDKSGKPYSISDTQLPVSALSSDGSNLLDLISAEDDKSYLAQPTSFSDKTIDETEFTFNVPENCKNGKLVINARNSWFLDHYYSEYLSLFGHRLTAWQDRLSRKSGEEMWKWKQEQGIPLQVYMKKEGEWIYQGHFETPGPMAFRKDVLPIDLSDVGEGTVNIKLTAGQLFWEIDQVGMDFSESNVIQSFTIKPHEASGNISEQILDLVLFDDDNYFVQEEIGDEAVLSFTVPEQAPNTCRSVFLHGKGHYRILTNSENAKSMIYLARFKKPESFTRFARDRHLELLEAIGK